MLLLTACILAKSDEERDAALKVLQTSNIPSVRFAREMREIRESLRKCAVFGRARSVDDVNAEPN
jgi:hypothetical protein